MGKQVPSLRKLCLVYQYSHSLFTHYFNIDLYSTHWHPSRATLTKVNRLIKFCRLLHRHFRGVDVVVGLVLDPNIDIYTIYTCVYNNAYTNLPLVIDPGVAAMRFAPSNMGRHLARPP
jgi:hypothetical protein